MNQKWTKKSNFFSLFLLCFFSRAYTVIVASTKSIKVTLEIRSISVNIYRTSFCHCTKAIVRLKSNKSGSDKGCLNNHRINMWKFFDKKIGKRETTMNMYLVLIFHRCQQKVCNRAQENEKGEKKFTWLSSQSKYFEQIFVENFR